MLITFDNAETAVAAYEMLKESTYVNDEGKTVSLLGKNIYGRIKK